MREAPVRIRFSTADPVLGWGTSRIPFQAGFLWCYYPVEIFHGMSSLPYNWDAAMWHFWVHGSAAELPKAEMQRPWTRHRNVKLEFDWEPLINNIDLERSVLQSWIEDGQDFSWSAWSEGGGLSVSAGNQVTRELCISRKAQSFCRTGLPKDHKLCGLMIHCYTKKTCSLASQYKLICLKCTRTITSKRNFAQ